MGCNYTGFCSLWKDFKCMVLFCVFAKSLGFLNSQDMYCWSFLQMRLLGHMGCRWSSFHSWQRRMWGNKPGFCTCCLLMGWIVQWSPLSPGTSSWFHVSLHPSSLVGLSRAAPTFAVLTLSWRSSSRGGARKAWFHPQLCMDPFATNGPQVLPPSQICQRDWHWLGWLGPSMVYGTKDGGEVSSLSFQTA